MTRRQRRAFLIASAVGIIGLATSLVLVALNDKVSYFKTPSELVGAVLSAEQRIRVGGLVVEGSVKRGNGPVVEFDLTDTAGTVTVAYRGILPDLFREGQGIIAEGRMVDGRFRADSVLAKHDATYMPPEVAKALKDKGVALGRGAEHPGGAATPAAGISK